VTDEQNYDDMKGGFVTLTRYGDVITLSMGELNDKSNKVKLTFSKSGEVSFEHKTPGDNAPMSIFDVLARFMEYP
jgi:hypothetical protein